MKMRAVSIVFCLIAFALSMVLMFNIYNSQARPEPIQKDDGPNSGDDQQPVEPDRTEPVTVTGIKKLSSDVSSFIDSLAYGSDKNYTVKMNEYIDQLERSAEYLGTEQQDSAGKDYLAKVASILRSAVDAQYMDTSALSAYIGTSLGEIDASKPQNPADPELYPQLDTDVNGSLTLALLAINNSKKPADVFTVTVGGSIMLGDVAGAGEGSFASEAEAEHGYTFPLGGVTALFSTDDYSIVTLRNPLTEETSSDDTRTAVKGRPDYANMLSTAGVNAVNLASDHMNDYGERGLADTKIALSSAGINFGANAELFDYDTQIGKIAIVSYELNSSAVSNNATAVNNSVKESIASARSRGAVMVVAMFSWSGNDNKEISDYQVSVGRTAVDNGADLVVGTFPQYIQAVDIYKDKTIIYSTNELITGKTDILSDGGVADPNGLIVSLDYTMSNGALTQSGITFYPVVSSSDTSRNNYTPKLVFDSTADTIVESLKNACVCTRYGIAKDSNPAKQEIKYIKINK